MTKWEIAGPFFGSKNACDRVLSHVRSTVSISVRGEDYQAQSITQKGLPGSGL